MESVPLRPCLGAAVDPMMIAGVALIAWGMLGIGGTGGMILAMVGLLLDRPRGPVSLVKLGKVASAYLPSSGRPAFSQAIIPPSNSYTLV